MIFISFLMFSFNHCVREGITSEKAREILTNKFNLAEEIKNRILAQEETKFCEKIEIKDLIVYQNRAINDPTSE